ncbi:hypothetical protein QBC43DRAFT_327578 [Cladorrhinum sp. PSN259]|nr:hypothetical protein QBC43DRAFT_327578 [Cladorrhinum sp. PSN259]
MSSLLSLFLFKFLSSSAATSNIKHNFAEMPESESETAPLPALTLSVLVLLDNIDPTLVLTFHDPYTATLVLEFPILLGPKVYTVRIDDKTFFGIGFKDPVDAQAWYDDKVQKKHFGALFQYSDATRHTIWIARAMSWPELQEKLPYGLPARPRGRIERHERPRSPFRTSTPTEWERRRPDSPRRDDSSEESADAHRTRKTVNRTRNVVDSIGKGIVKLQGIAEKRTL